MKIPVKMDMCEIGEGPQMMVRKVSEKVTVNAVVFFLLPAVFLGKVLTLPSNMLQPCDGARPRQAPA